MPARSSERGGADARRTLTVARDAGAALRGARPRALVVRARAARAGADEARPSAAPVSRQVHPAARRGALSPARARRAAACSIRSPARERRSSRRSRAGSSRPASTSRRSTACYAREDGARTTRSSSSTSCATRSARFERGEGDGRPRRPPTSRAWFAPQARGRSAAVPLARWPTTSTPTCCGSSLARAARSARLTTHFDLDFPDRAADEPYWCHKHKRECRPVERAEHFLRRYTLDTLARLKEFSRVRSERAATVLHGDAREVDAGEGRSTRSSPRRRTRA